jgi:hypothetical protein
MVEFQTITLPSFMASALINGDTSGIEESEDKEAMLNMRREFALQGINPIFVSCSDDEYFSKGEAWDCHPTARAGNVLDFMYDPHEAVDFAGLKAEFNLMCDGDGFGTAMAFWFAIAAELYEREGDAPASWSYRPSPMGAIDPDQYEAEICAMATTEALHRFGALMERYVRRCKHAGKDY